MRAVQSLYSLNRGVVSPLGVARQDVKRLALAAQVQTNFMPRVLGAMMLRPGWQYLGATYANAAARYLRFIFATDDTALVELTDQIMRVWISDAPLTRVSVSTTIANGSFGLAGSWTSLDEAGATSSLAANAMTLYSLNGTAYAIREQNVSVAGGDVNKEHGIRITVATGPVALRIGSTSGDDDLLSETTLGTGVHSLAVTPTGGNMYIRFQSRLSRTVTVSNIAVESAGALALPAPWLAADLDAVRYDQSGDVVYIACDGYQQRRIERRGTRPNARSWSIVVYEPEDGPFKVMNTSATTITPAGLTGDITLTASRSTFKSGHVGALFAFTSTGQRVSTTTAVAGTATNSVRVSDVWTDRTILISLSAIAAGSQIDLQRSLDDATWTNVPGQSWTANVSTSYTDGLSNQIVYYRLILTSRVAPDIPIMDLRIGTGSVRGVTRIYEVVSETVAYAHVLKDLGGTDATTDWQEGQWSDQNGWPSAVGFHEGRLWWSGVNGIWGSVSDSYDSFDETIVGDSGPINRTIGSGPVDVISWMKSTKGLMIGAHGAEVSIRASSLDEFITPTNFNVKFPTTQGSGRVDAVKIDQAVYFVNRSRLKVFEAAFDLRSYDYVANSLMELCPDICRPGIVRMDVQRLPDTRIHCVKSDGTAVVIVINRTEEVLAAIPITTRGYIEDVAVLPALDGDADDRVYYCVRRSISGTVRYLEKWSQEIDCLGDQQLCYLADSWSSYSGTARTAITGLGHLEGQQVVVWADGDDVGTDDSTRPWTQRYTVVSGRIMLAVAASNVVVGLPYTAQFKSAKLGVALNGISPLNQQKSIDHIGLVLANTHTKGLKFGPTLDDTGSMRMDDMPEIERGTTVSGTAVAYDENVIEFPGTWTTDSRICLQAQAPRPCTVLAITYAGDQYS